MTHELTIHEQLLQFPLFLGMSYDDLMEVAGHTVFEFRNIAAGQVVVAEGSPCTHIWLLTSGSVTAETAAAGGAYSVEETLSAPLMLQPERLFGINSRHTSTFMTAEDCSFISIEKQEVFLLLETQIVFRLNMLNLMATRVQRLEQYAWRQASRTLRERLVRFLLSHSLYPAGRKTFHILMRQLADELNASRLEVSEILNGLQKEGLLHLHRGRIEIPMMERLIMAHDIKAMHSRSESSQ